MNACILHTAEAIVYATIELAGTTVYPVRSAELNVWCFPYIQRSLESRARVRANE